MVRGNPFPGHSIATPVFVSSIYVPILQTHGPGFTTDELPFLGTPLSDKFLGL